MSVTSEYRQSVNTIVFNVADACQVMMPMSCYVGRAFLHVHAVGLHC